MSHWIDFNLTNYNEHIEHENPSARESMEIAPTPNQGFLQHQSIAKSNLFTRNRNETSMKLRFPFFFFAALQFAFCVYFILCISEE